MTRKHRSPVVAAGLPLAALAASIIVLGPARPARAQDVPGDDVPAQQQPAARPPTPPPPPPPAPGGTGRVIAGDLGPVPPNLPLASGASEDIPPLPRGTVAAPGYPTPRYKLRYEERRLNGLMVAGLAVFGGAWLMSAMFGGYVSDRGWFYMPVVGPIIYKSDDKAQQAALIMDTIVQAGGVAMALAGAFVKVRTAVREPITLVPTVVPGGGAGLSLSGTF